MHIKYSLQIAFCDGADERIQDMLPPRLLFVELRIKGRCPCITSPVIAPRSASVKRKICRGFTETF